MPLKILVAMSGGVDSSVAALDLVESGNWVEGLTLRLFDSCGSEDSRSCCSLEDIEKARNTAAFLGIKHRVIDLQDSFRHLVIDPFVDNYASGETPNPCILCNKLIKFGILLDYAAEEGYDAVATGHYARIVLHNGKKRLARGISRDKDQSYVLFTLTPNLLDKIIFPLGEHTKEKVRKRAEKAGLPSAQKRESQDICFIGPEGLPAFLDSEIKDTIPGIVQNSKGKKIGKHLGIHRYTVGQRRGLGIPSNERLYVSSIDPTTGRITLVPSKELGTERFTVRDWVWHTSSEDRPMEMEVQVRYHQRAERAVLRDRIGNGLVLEWTGNKRCVTPGQAAVGYVDGLVAGGGWISGSEQ